MAFSVKTVVADGAMEELGGMTSILGVKLSDTQLASEFTTKEIEHEKGGAACIAAFTNAAPCILVLSSYIVNHLFSHRSYSSTWRLSSLSPCLAESHGSHSVIGAFPLIPSLNLITLRLWPRRAGFACSRSRWGANIFVEILRLQSLCFYAGDGWLTSISEVWSERRASIYFANFLDVGYG